MHPPFTARPRSPRGWTALLAQLLPAGVISLFGILLLSQMMASEPAKNPVSADPRVSWRVPVASGPLATVVRDEAATAKPAAQKLAEAPTGRPKTSAAKSTHPALLQGARQEAPVGAPLELAAWQRPDPAPVRPRADLTGARPAAPAVVSLAEPVRRVIVGAQQLPEKVQTWIGDAADWVGGGLTSVLPSRDGLRASL